MMISKKRRNKRILSVSALAVLTACAAFAYWWLQRTPEGPLRQATAVTLLTFRQDDENWEKQLSRRITDPATVRNLTSKVECKPIWPCKCDHFEQLVFDTPAGPVNASVCDHCFDVQGWGHYAMPPELWKVLAPRFKEMEEPPDSRWRKKRAP